jgi:hypothetical protein
MGECFILGVLATENASALAIVGRGTRAPRQVGAGASGTESLAGVEAGSGAACSSCGGAWPWGRASLPERWRDRPSSPACVIFLGFPNQRGFGPLRDQSALLLGERSMLNAGSEPPRARRLHSHPPKIGRQGTDVGLEPFCRGSSVSVLGLAARRYPSESASKELSTTAYFQFE